MKVLVSLLTLGLVDVEMFLPDRSVAWVLCEALLKICLGLSISEIEDGVYPALNRVLGVKCCVISNNAGLAPCTTIPRCMHGFI
jgi:hypothetical protein